MAFANMIRGLLPQLVLGDELGIKIPQMTHLDKVEKVPTMPESMKSDFEKNLDKTKAALLEDPHFNAALKKFGDGNVEFPDKVTFKLPQEKAKLAEFLVNQNAHLVSTQDPPEFGKEPAYAASQIGYRFDKVATKHTEPKK